MADLAKDAADFMRHSLEGDQAMADLDAIGASIAVQNMFGDYFTTQYVLDYLLQDF